MQTAWAAHLCTCISAHDCARVFLGVHTPEWGRHCDRLVSDLVSLSQFMPNENDIVGRVQSSESSRWLVLIHAHNMLPVVRVSILWKLAEWHLGVVLSSRNCFGELGGLRKGSRQAVTSLFWPAVPQTHLQCRLGTVPWNISSLCPVNYTTPRPKWNG